MIWGENTTIFGNTYILLKNNSVIPKSTALAARGKLAEFTGPASLPLLGCPGTEVNGSMVRIHGVVHLLINGVFLGVLTHLLTIDPNFLGHPSEKLPSNPTGKARLPTIIFQGRAVKLLVPVPIPPKKSWKSPSMNGR